METKKIVVACFVGGALCCAVALMFAPVYWWFGLIAGFAGGYISYEFREVFQAVPVALRAARKSGASVWEDTITGLENAIDRARVWISKPHPFFYPAVIIAAPLYLWGAPYIFDFEHILQLDVFRFIMAFVMVIFGFVAATLVVIALFAIIAFIGARVGERCYWWPFLMYEDDTTIKEDVLRLEGKGLQRKPATYSNVLRWTAKGFGLTVIFFIWTLWKHLVIGIWATLCFIGRFACHLFKLVHSKKRLLCAIDGTLGGAMSYVWFTSTPMSFAGQIALITFGGLLGATFGAANWEIVSKRILHVPASI